MQTSFPPSSTARVVEGAGAQPQDSTQRPGAQMAASSRSELAGPDPESAEEQDRSVELPAVCIIVPALNEARYIDACLTSLQQQVQCRVIEIIVADGGSTDGTIDLIRTRHPAVRVIDNPKRIQSAGINLAVSIADPGAEVIVRADAHVAYAPDFVAQCLTAMKSNAATSVVVPMRTVGTTGFQRAVAFVQNSRLGNGGAAHRVGGGRSGFVDHGHHAAFDRRFFNLCNGYDESFTHNEDAELDHRAQLAGGRIWMCTSAAVDYFPRARADALARQYFRNGRGRSRTMIKHHMRPRLRQLAPVVLLFIVVFGFLLAFLRWEIALVPLAYFLLCSLIGAVAAIKQRDPWLLVSGPAAIIMHLSYGVGFVSGHLKHWLGRDPIPSGA